MSLCVSVYATLTWVLAARSELSLQPVKVDRQDELLPDTWSSTVPLVLASVYCHGNFDVLFLDELLWF